jgi:hypothetical protein
MIIEIKRFYSKEDCTLGALLIDGEFFCNTLENPWLDNKANISCIPFGRYIVKRVNSPKYGDTFEVKEVYERTYILFHAGNTSKDTKGCILLGNQIGKLGSETAVYSSKNTVRSFMKKLKGIESFELKIKEN